MLVKQCVVVIGKFYKTKNNIMISIATFNKEEIGMVLRDNLAFNGIESTLISKVAFNSTSNVAKIKHQF